MTTPAVTPQIEGLPPGAVLRPISPAAAAPPPIEGLPPGAIVKPITGYQGPMTSTGIAAPQGTADWAGAGIQGAKDLLTGMSEGAANTVGSSVAGVSRLLNKIPVLGKYLAPEQGIQALEARTAEASAPQNPAQSIGRTGEQVGEWLVPSGAEEKAGALAAEHLPALGRLAGPIARILTGAGETGVRNASQGGSPAVGAAAGAIGGGLGEAARAAAPSVAESALGITKRMRGYGKTPGVAALEETSGLAPATIEKQAQQKIGGLTSGIESSAAAHPGTVSLQPAIDTIDQEIAKATSQNNGQAIEQLGRVKDALTKGAVTGNPLAVDQSASNALNMKRGLRSQFVKNWNPELMSGTRAVAAKASGAIDNSLDTALGPDFQSANQKISSLIPVAERSESLERDPSIAQKVGNRVAAHTGALIGSAAGGAEGYREHGAPGAVIGSLAGLTIPELLAHPATQMAAARVMNNPGVLIRLLQGAGLQFNRPSQENQQ